MWEIQWFPLPKCFLKMHTMLEFYFQANFYEMIFNGLSIISFSIFKAYLFSFAIELLSLAI